MDPTVPWLPAPPYWLLVHDDVPEEVVDDDQGLDEEEVSCEEECELDDCDPSAAANAEDLFQAPRIETYFYQRRPNLTLTAWWGERELYMPMHLLKTRTTPQRMGNIRPLKIFVPILNLGI